MKEDEQMKMETFIDNWMARSFNESAHIKVNLPSTEIAVALISET